MLTAFSSFLFSQTDEVKAINNFTFRFFQEIEQTSNSNMIFSGLSIHSALSMCYLGTGNETKKEYKKILFENKDNDFTSYGKSILNLSNKNNFDNHLLIANKLWVDKNLQVDQEFVAQTQTHFKNKVETIDLNNIHESAKKINFWVETNTNDQIKNFITPDLINNSKLVITNAISFNMKWLIPFKKEEEDIFYTQDGNEVRTKFISGNSIFAYDETHNYETYIIPYNGCHQSMMIVVPKGDNDLESIKSNVFTNEFIHLSTSLGSLMHINEGALKIPKFEHKQKSLVNDNLANMGMINSFTPNADYSKIGKGVTFNRVLHEATIKVGLEGTTAGAATSISATRGIPHNLKIVNKPFYYFIMDKDSYTILFMGKYVSP